MDVRLQSMKLNNFKGLREFAATFGDKPRIYGDNATGKTTLFDAFFWVLFDKDSANRKDFEIKTLGPDNQPIHGIEHSVEVVLAVDGKTVELKKVYAEKWTKRRGSATAEFTGHTTEYFVDGVPVKQTDYKDRIASILQEDTFKLLTSPLYFNEVLNWQKRREILLQVCGDVTNEEVIASNDALAELPELIGNRTIEDFRKVVNAKRNEINKELEKIPVRIDEASRAKPDASKLDAAALQSELDALQYEIQSGEQIILDLQNGAGTMDVEKQLREVDLQMLQRKQALQQEGVEGLAPKQQAVATMQGDLYRIQEAIANHEDSIRASTTKIAALESQIQTLRSEWADVNATQCPDSDATDTCPTCGQPLPEAQVQEAREKAVADFNVKKSQRLRDIAEAGKQKKAELESAQKILQSATESCESSRQLLADYTDRLIAAKDDLAQSQQSVGDPSQDTEYCNLQQQKDALAAKLETLRLSTEKEVARIRESINNTRSKATQIARDLAMCSQAQELDKRIQTLRDQERTLAAEYEKLEASLFLTEEFVRTKVQLLESHINSKFERARFKLFSEQVNGGLAETCETLYNGVPYGSLNNAMRINIGLDILNTLSRHYDLHAPIFIDNAEAVTELLPTEGQCIALYVSEADKQLRIEN